MFAPSLSSTQTITELFMLQKDNLISEPILWPKAVSKNTGKRGARKSKILLLKRKKKSHKWNTKSWQFTDIDIQRTEREREIVITETVVGWTRASAETIAVAAALIVSTLLLTLLMDSDLNSDSESDSDCDPNKWAKVADSQLLRQRRWLVPTK